MPKQSRVETALRSPRYSLRSNSPRTRRYLHRARIQSPHHPSQTHRRRRYTIQHPTALEDFAHEIGEALADVIPDTMYNTSTIFIACLVQMELLPDSELQASSAQTRRNVARDIATVLAEIDPLKLDIMANAIMGQWVLSELSPDATSPAGSC